MFAEIPLRNEGWLRYSPAFLRPDIATRLFEQLREQVPWSREGRPGRLFPRLIGWYSDPGVSYTYSGISHDSAEWLPVMHELRRTVEAACGTQFNSVLLNFYRDGRDSMGFHADDEPELGRNPTIASVSLGGERRFVLKHNSSAEKREFVLSHGSLLVMGGTCQQFWKHAVPKTKKRVPPRINLTFRWIGPDPESRTTAEQSR